MFVPGLAMLPLAPSIGSMVDVAKVLSLIVLGEKREHLHRIFGFASSSLTCDNALGFMFTMATTSFLVLGLRSAQGLIEDVEVTGVTNNENSVPKTVAAPKKPFTESTMKFLAQGTALTGALSVAATRSGNKFSTPLRTVFMFFGTVATYVFGARLPSGKTLLGKCLFPWLFIRLLTSPFTH